MNRHLSKARRWISGGVALAAAAGGGLGADDALELAPFAVETGLGFNDEPAMGLATAVTALRFSPGVDLQARGYPELQSDLTIRGSTFEQTSLRLGVLPVYDPQTGHYTAELPFSSAMLTAPRFATGTANAFGGFNSSVGTLALGWAPIEERGFLMAGGGTDALWYGELYQGARLGGASSPWRIDLGMGHGQGDGTIEQGDFRVSRISGRLQHLSNRGQTDLFVGYLDKFYGWPGLYVADVFGRLFPETDEYQNTVVGLNHERRFPEGHSIAFGALVRQMDDDYEFNRLAPGTAFEHLTRSASAALEGAFSLNEQWSFRGRLLVVQDELVRSTSLTHGDGATGNDFTKRNHLRGALAAAYEWKREHLAGRIDFGLTGAATDQDAGRISPMGRLELQVWRAGEDRLLFFADLAESSQVAGYTALRSPQNGLFGGNPNLGVEVSRSFESGLRWAKKDWELHALVFHRADRDLLDWTFVSSNVNPSSGKNTARQANALELDTYGIEVSLRRLLQRGEWALGAAWMEKQPDYGSGAVDASFYALNFPEIRVTANARWEILASRLEVEGDLEWRQQYENSLRNGSANATLVTLSLRWRPWRKHLTQLVWLGDNLLDDDFEEFPGTPGVGRHFSIRLVHPW